MKTHMDIRQMEEMFLCGQKLYSWQIDQAGALLHSNAPSQTFFYDLFLLGNGFERLISYFADQQTPAIFCDKTGIAWIGAYREHTLFLLGPFFTVSATEKYIWHLCSRLNISQEMMAPLQKQLALLPAHPLNTANAYAVMLHYCVTGQQISASMVHLFHEVSEPEPDASWGSVNWHGTWEIERRFFSALRDGNIPDLTAALTEFSAGQVGTICPEDPLRQAKDELIVFITLCSRCAILGGVSPEGAYNLSDYYLQRVEACRHVSDVQNYSLEMCESFLRRIRQARKNSSYSTPVASCMEYIETHICEKISLEEMARSAGYTEYYLSAKFQRETGMTINYFIQKRKIDRSKDLLLLPGLSIADVAERLSFSSPSYFTAIFRKYTGMRPGDWRVRAQSAHGQN